MIVATDKLIVTSVPDVRCLLRNPLIQYLIHNHRH